MANSESFVRDAAFLEYGIGNDSSLEDIQAPVESIITDEQLEELTNLFFPPNLISNAELDQHWEHASPQPAAVNSIWEAPEITSSLNVDALGESNESNLDLGLGDPVSTNLPVVDVVQTQSQGLSTIKELVSPGAAALRESNGSGKKPRKRKNQPVVHGNNPYGKRGKKSCRACRKWKIKCEYDSEDVPCRLCCSRGWNCGTEDKILGPKGQRAVSERSNVLSASSAVVQYVFPVTRISLVPEEKTMSSLDARLLGRFLQHSTSAVVKHILGPLVQHTWTPAFYPILAECFRYSLLACASIDRRFGPSPSEHTYRYLQKSYRLTRQSAEACEYRHVLYSSYLLFLYEHEGFRCNERSYVHCLGMWQAFAALESSSQASQAEMEYMECLAHGVLRSQYNHFRDKIGHGVAHGQKEKQFALLRATCNMGEWYWEETTRKGKILQFSILFEIFSQFYVLQRNLDAIRGPDHYNVKARLERIIDQIITLIPEIPELWLTTLARGPFENEFVYAPPPFFIIAGPNIPPRARYFARLHYSAVIVKCTLHHDPTEAELQTAVSAATSLLAVSINARAQTCWDTDAALVTSLLLAGMVLCQSQNSIAVIEWIRPSVLRHEKFWYVYAGNIELVFWLLEAAAGCTSLHDIWGVKYGDFSLMNIRGGFAPWFDDGVGHHWVAL